MAETWGSLAQTRPAAATLTASYTVPALKRATVEVVICSLGAATTVRLSHAIGGAADTLAQYLFYDYALAAADTKVTVRFVVAAGDVLRVYSTSGDVTFNTNGIEEDV